MPNIKERSDYDADAIHALVQFSPKYTFDTWEVEIEVILEEEECTFPEAVYMALVENYRENR